MADEDPAMDAESPDPLATADETRLVLAEPESLIQALRFLQKRIPGFVQLSIREERAMTRAAFLDPEFVEAGLRAGDAWDDTAAVIGHSSDELRGEAEQIRLWDEVESEMRALLKGISAANRIRRYQLGSAILDLYSLLGRTIERESKRHLRPYYEAMQRAYRERKRRPRKKKEPAGEEES